MRLNQSITGIFGVLALTLLLVGHLYFTYVYKALSGMTRGYVDVDDARLELSRGYWWQMAAATLASTPRRSSTATSTSMSVKPSRRL